MRRRSGALESATPEEFVKVTLSSVVLNLLSWQHIQLSAKIKNTTQT